MDIARFFSLLFHVELGWGPVPGCWTSDGPAALLWS